MTTGRNTAARRGGSSSRGARDSRAERGGGAARRRGGERHGDPRREPDREPGPPRGRGLPDGVLIGGLAFLLFGTAAVWAATGLAGLLTTGSWPDVAFTRTPAALRRLASEPDDLVAAWRPPGAVQPAVSALPSGRAFWVVLAVLLLVVTALVVTALVAGTRWRARRRAGMERARSDEPAEEAPRPVPDARRARRAHDAKRAPVAPRRTTVSDGTSTRVAAAPVGGAAATGAAAPGPPAPVPVPRAAAPDTGDGAAAAVVARHLSAPALRERAALIRPALPRTGPAAVHHSGDELLALGLALGTHRPTGETLHGGLDQTFLLLAGPHAEQRGGFLRETLAGAPGAAVVTCPDADTYRATVRQREKLGPVLVHDPLQRTDAATRLRWAPERGCGDPLRATSRARAMLFPVRPPGRPAMADSAVAARLSHAGAVDAAQTVLACWLHAAALDGRTFRHILRWLGQPAGAGLREPVRVLRSGGGAAPGWDGRLEDLLSRPSAERDGALGLLERVLGAAGELHVLQSCLPPAAEEFDPESWVNERGTLYVVGDPVEDPRSGPGVLPLSTALVEDVVEQGRRIAVGSSSGRLDPPMLLLLDDVATVAPLPGLPDVMTGGGALGLPAVCVLRSPEQARHRWGGAAASLHRAAGIRLAMGEVPAHDLATVLGVAEAEAERLADALRDAGAEARIVHHAAGPAVVASATGHEG